MIKAEPSQLMKTLLLLAFTVVSRPLMAENPTQIGSEREGVLETSQANPVATHRTKGWLIHQTPNFRICTRDVDTDYTELAKHCETLRDRLQANWFGEASKTSWTPRCDIIVHASLFDYQCSLGRGVGQSVGCATLKLDGERIVSRQIDIRVDAENWWEDALPHELTHIVLADRFTGKCLPRWADEGMGVLAESRTKQSKRFNALKQSTTGSSIYRAAELLHLTKFPRARYRDAFYGQSATLVQSLVDRESPKRFLDFIEVALESGYGHALQRVYGIEDLEQLGELSHTAVTDPSPIWMRSQADITFRLAAYNQQ